MLVKKRLIYLLCLKNLQINLFWSKVYVKRVKVYFTFCFYPILGKLYF
ncbi:hypothetical protein HMPREF5505_1407 [Lactobacillus delbrueckii subsp. lactis DSM 20072]|nr:hypothetical protein HMPREF5505_1407 [Lactobacillus delbrueckii subsp. lactis DSM 20072]